MKNKNTLSKTNFIECTIWVSVILAYVYLREAHRKRQEENPRIRFGKKQRKNQRMKTVNLQSNIILLITTEKWHLI